MADIKKFRDILGDMVTWVKDHSTLTNFRVGSAIRTILEAVSLEFESIYFYLRDQFSQAADNAVYDSFGFARIPAISASGSITLIFKSPLTQKLFVPTGTRYFTIPLQNQVLYFSSISDVFAVEGDTQLSVPVACEQAGDVGNVPAYSIRRAVQPNAIVQDIYNVAEFFNGAPEETPSDRSKRFSDYIASLARGTIPAIEYGVGQIPGIVGVDVTEGSGVIYVYAHDANGNLGTDLIQAIENTLYEYKCGGIKAIISPVTIKSIDLNLDVTLATGFDPNQYSQSISQSVIAFLNNFKVGKGLTRADLITFIMGIDQRAILNVDIGLKQDITALPYELIRAGNVQVTIM
jgi:hypothetical protein